ncbi:hypothetical protein [Mangrovihabitans endophyticus]|uniref:hypothetical protein n=1 Tax=Mangrovihabitans endophyticus TaxID=1751298 RepID=UPI0016640FDE|nr:hypothetical protein [Mangrovihabitans endophyticus]
MPQTADWELGRQYMRGALGADEFLDRSSRSQPLRTTVAHRIATFLGGSVFVAYAALALYFLATRQLVPGVVSVVGALAVVAYSVVQLRR